MATHDSEYSLQVEESSLTMASLLASFDDEPDLRSSLQAAKIVIVPTVVDAENEIEAFPHTTREVYQHLKAEFNEPFAVEAAVSEEDYKEFEYRSEIIILPAIFVATNVLLPIVVGILSAYIYDRLRHLDGGTVESTLHFKDGKGKPTSLEYKGPAASYERIVTQLIQDRKLASGEDVPSRNDE